MQANIKNIRTLNDLLNPAPKIKNPSTMAV
jgi:hypothetical protein